MPSGDFKIKKDSKIIQSMSKSWKRTSALNKGGWSSKRPGRFTLGKNPLYLLNRRLSGLEVLENKKFMYLLEFEPKIIQSLA
jgi:hypothetical protein